jgi:hypothetical protein
MTAVRQLGIEDIEADRILAAVRGRFGGYLERAGAQ